MLCANGLKPRHTENQLTALMWFSSIFVIDYASAIISGTLTAFLDESGITGNHNSRFLSYVKVRPCLVFQECHSSHTMRMEQVTAHIAKNIT